MDEERQKRKDNEKKWRKAVNGASLCAMGLGIALSCIKYNSILHSALQPFEGIEFTQFDKNYTEAFLKEYKHLNKEAIVFTNKELYEWVIRKIGKDDVTKNDFLMLDSLSLIGLSNTDLSDLKYLPNLQNLQIKNMKVDAEDLKFNQNLNELHMYQVELENTFDLPNTLKEIKIYNSRVVDKEFLLPYYLENLDIEETYFNYLHLKNPSSLRNMVFFSYSLLDLDWIKDCTNLKEMTIFRSPNIKNVHILEQFISKCQINLDDYGVISIPTSLLEIIYREDSENELVRESKQLDVIAATLLEENMTEEEKVCAIALYILKKYEYDTDSASYLGENYNNKPLYYALSQDEIICVNYASLFSALAMRMNLPNYQLMSEKHTWNEVVIKEETRQIDVTKLDARALRYMPVFSSTPTIKCYEAEESSTFFIENGSAESLVYYLFTNDIVNRLFKEERGIYDERRELHFENKKPYYIEGIILNKTIELARRNENIGYIEIPKDIDPTEWKKVLFPLVATGLVVIILRQGSYEIINAQKKKTREQILKKIRKEDY